MLTVASIGGTIGKEKKEVLSKSIIYSGYRGNIYLSSIFEKIKMITINILTHISIHECLYIITKI